MPAAERLRALSPEPRQIRSMDEEQIRRVIKQVDEGSVELTRQQLQTV